MKRLEEMNKAELIKVRDNASRLIDEMYKKESLKQRKSKDQEYKDLKKFSDGHALSEEQILNILKSYKSH